MVNDHIIISIAVGTILTIGIKNNTNKMLSIINSTNEKAKYIIEHGMKKIANTQKNQVKNLAGEKRFFICPQNISRTLCKYVAMLFILVSGVNSKLYRILNSPTSSLALKYSSKRRHVVCHFMVLFFEIEEQFIAYFFHRASIFSAIICDDLHPIQNLVDA